MKPRAFAPSLTDDFFASFLNQLQSRQLSELARVFSTTALFKEVSARAGRLLSSKRHLKSHDTCTLMYTQYTDTYLCKIFPIHA